MKSFPKPRAHCLGPLPCRPVPARTCSLLCSS